MNQPLRSISITETSSLLRVGPPLFSALVLWHSWGLPICASPLASENRFPRSTHEPRSSSRRLHAGRHLGSRQVASQTGPGWTSHPPVLTLSKNFRHVFSGSLAFVSLIHTWSVSSDLFLNAHHHGFWPQQLKAVWSLHLHDDSEGPALISRAASWRTDVVY